MANNRIYIRCRTCGDTIKIASCGLDGYICCKDDVELTRFFQEHKFCDRPLNENEINALDTPFKQEDSYENRFEIAYEFENKEEE